MHIAFGSDYSLEDMNWWFILRAPMFGILKLTTMQSPALHL